MYNKDNCKETIILVHNTVCSKKVPRSIRAMGCPFNENGMLMNWPFRSVLLRSVVFLRPFRSVLWCSFPSFARSVLQTCTVYPLRVTHERVQYKPKKLSNATS